MKIKGSLISLSAKALAESFGTDMIRHTAAMVIQNYDLHDRLGFPHNIPIPARDAAQQVVRDIAAAELFIDFITLLIRLSTEGYMGRRYQINHLNDIVREMFDIGLVYDKVNRTFVEDSSVRQTPNWGTLKTDTEYGFALLRLDIVGNTKLVKKHPPAVIEKTYGDFRHIVERCVSSRNGRIWSWEGDGGMVAFYFGNRNLQSAFAGIEIAHQLYLYNLNGCPLGSPLEVRTAIHCGTCPYTPDPEKLKKLDLVKRTIEAEASHTKPNTLTLTESVFHSLPESVRCRFRRGDFKDGMSYYRYEIRTEGK